MTQTCIEKVGICLSHPNKTLLVPFCFVHLVYMKLKFTRWVVKLRSTKKNTHNYSNIKSLHIFKIFKTKKVK